MPDTVHPPCRAPRSSPVASSPARAPRSSALGRFPTDKLTLAKIESERRRRKITQFDLCIAAGINPTTYSRRLGKADPERGHRRTLLKLNTALAAILAAKEGG
jgi:hypothetical protein